tara:strand:- start:345 stop:668 length:324 start_codon:yes stop_codon:yes gene_type:complete
MKNLVYFVLGCAVTGFIWWDVECNPKDSRGELLAEQQERLTIHVGWNPQQNWHGNDCSRRSIGNRATDPDWSIKNGWFDEKLVLTYRDKEEFLEMRAKLWKILDNNQ